MTQQEDGDGQEDGMFGRWRDGSSANVCIRPVLHARLEPLLHFPFREPPFICAFLFYLGVQYCHLHCFRMPLSMAIARWGG